MGIYEWEVILRDFKVIYMVNILRDEQATEKGVIEMLKNSDEKFSGMNENGDIVFIDSNQINTVDNVRKRI